MENNGWVKLHRKFQKWEWYQKSEVVHLFLHFLLSANHEDGKWQGQEVKRGQFITGLKKLNEQTGISTQSIRTVINLLKSTGEITSKSTNKYRIITVVKYNDYQDEYKCLTSKLTSKLTINQQSTNNQLTSNNNDKNEKNSIAEASSAQPIKREPTEEGKLANELIGFFKDEYTRLSGVSPVITSWARYNTATQKYIKLYGLEKMKQAVRCYFEDEDKFYANDKYPINKFLTDGAIQRYI